MQSEPLIYRVDDIEVDTARGCIVRDGREVPLTPKAFRVLVHLVKERDRLVPKEELMQFFWADTAVTDDALSQCIARLRRALGDDPRNPAYLKTVPRMGYRFVGPVQETLSETVAVPEVIHAPAPAPSASTSEVRRTEWRSPVIRRIGWVIAGSLMAGSLGAGAFWATTALYRPPPAVQGKRVVAILPFENRSGQSDLDWLRDGLPDMLATTFSRSKSLDVLSRGQVNAHRKAGETSGFNADLEFARASHAQAAVTGSYSKLGNSMRVDVSIYDTATGSVLGTDDMTVDRQDRILTQVDFLAARLAGRLGPQTPRTGVCSARS